MAQLVVAAAGAAIGGATLGTGVVALGMTGTAIGWMAGSLIGSMFAKGPDGPKIEDGKFSSSIYGQPIPLNYGTMRHATQIAWWSGLIVRTEEVGGKGGGGAEIERSRMNLLLAVCEGPQAGVLRVWANGRLIATYTGRRYELDKDVLPSGDVRVYLGTEDQMPDPTYEEAVGTENACAYRGTVMLAIDGLEGAQFGDRPPNIEVEVTGTVEVDVGCPLDPIQHVTPEATLWKGADLLGRTATVIDDETGRFFILGGDQGRTLYVYQANQGRLTLTHAITLGIGAVTGMGLNPDTRKLWVVSGDISPGSSRTPVAAIIDADSLSVENSWAKLVFYVGESGGCHPDGIWCCDTLLYNWNGGTGADGNEEGGTGAVWGAIPHFDPETGGLWWSWASSTSLLVQPYLIAPGLQTQKVVQPWPICSRVDTLGNGYVHAGRSLSSTGEISDAIYIPAGTAWTGALNYRVSLFGRLELITPNGATHIGDIGTGFGARSFAWSASRRKLYVVGGGVWVIDLDAEDGDPLVATELDVSDSYVAHDAGGAAWSNHYDGLVLLRHGLGFRESRVIDPDTDTILEGPCSLLPGLPTDRGPVLGLREIGSGWFAGFTGFGGDLAIIKMPGATALGGPTTLQAIVEDVSLRAGLPAGNLDATAGTDVIDGFKVARQTSAKAVIESLRPGYFFDMPEVGTKLVLTKRGAPVVAAISSGELGASLFQVSRDEPVPPYEIEHVEAQEIPRRLELSYVDYSADYDPGVQVAERQVGESRSPLQVELPVVINAEGAARIAWGNLLLAHASAHTIRLALTHHYAALTPSDSIEIMHASGDTLRVRIEQITRARPLVEIEGAIEDASVYEQTMGGVIRYQGPTQSGTAQRADTILHLLDLPPLRAVDDTLLFYGAMSRSFVDGYWYGGAAYKSLDGESYSLIYSTSAEAVVGELTATLPAWTRGNRWDRTSRIRVQLRHGTLSIASELAVLNGANACAVGHEVVQFANATLVGDSEWELDTLLRHRIGTEWAANADKSAGTPFVLLTESRLRAVEYPLADAGTVRQWRGVTSGQAVADAATLNVTAAGNSVKPLAPVHIASARDMSGNLSVSWVRRARINAEWQDFSDVPLDEATERYLVVVYDDALRTTVVRTDTVTAAAWAYSAADQTTDLGSPQAEVFIDLHQLDSEYNAIGHAARETV